MVDTKMRVEAPAHMLEQIREVQHRVERAGKIAGAAGAAADLLRELAQPGGGGHDIRDALTGIADRLDAACERAAQHMAPMAEVRPGDVVQVDPNGDELGFGGAFAVVERNEGWGVVAYVRIPGPNGGDAYVRLGNGQFEKIGVAEWTHDPLAKCTDGTPVGDLIAKELAMVPVWKAAMDASTCTPCREQDGKEVTPALAPPHPDCTCDAGCRCVIVGLPRG